PVVDEIVRAALEDADGFALDGYPRNLSQAEYLDDIADLDLVALLDVDRGELIDRLTGRRVCEECGTNYHVEFSPPEEAGVCDECGGDLTGRFAATPSPTAPRPRCGRPLRPVAPAPRPCRGALRRRSFGWYTSRRRNQRRNGGVRIGTVQ
ncbi:hypothetical protein BRC99_05115, partial [Halobacteriales archaeon QS_7_69_60]